MIAPAFPTWASADGRATIYTGDCLDVMRGMDAGSVDAVVTDPPYGMDWDTDTTRFSGGLQGVSRGKEWASRVHGDSEPFDPSPWLDFPRVVLFGSNHYAARLPVGTTLVWIKRNDHAFGTFLSDAEIAWMKGGHGVYCYREVGANALRAQEAFGEVAHPCQKPVGLMRWCIRRLGLKPGAVILDPFMGSGTTLVAALQEGCKAIGIEREAPYVEIAKARVAHEAAQGRLFA